MASEAACAQNQTYHWHIAGTGVRDYPKNFRVFRDKGLAWSLHGKARASQYPESNQY
jgi:hypothetical protein